MGGQCLGADSRAWEASAVWVEVGSSFAVLPAENSLAQSRLLMRQTRQLLDLHFLQGLSQRVIARSLGVARTTVERVLKRFAGTGLTWPPDPALSDEELGKTRQADFKKDAGARGATPVIPAQSQGNSLVS